MGSKRLSESDRFVANYLCEEWKKYVESCADADQKQPAPDEEGSGERAEAGYIERGGPAGDRQRIYGWDEGVASLPDEYFKSVSEPTDERIGGMESWPDGVPEEE